jgi:hypothetical protein
MSKSGKSRHWSDGKGGFRAAACRFYAEHLDDYLATGADGKRTTREVMRELSKALSEYVNDAQVETEVIPPAERAKGQHAVRTRLVGRGDKSWSVPAISGGAGTSLGSSQHDLPKGRSVLAAHEDAPPLRGARPSPRVGYEDWKLMRSIKAGHSCGECLSDIELGEWIHYNGRRGNEAEAVHVACDPITLHHLRKPPKPIEPTRPAPQTDRPLTQKDVLKIDNPKVGVYEVHLSCGHVITATGEVAERIDSMRASGGGIDRARCAECTETEAAKWYDDQVAAYEDAMPRYRDAEAHYDKWAAELERLIADGEDT